MFALLDWTQQARQPWVHHSYIVSDFSLGSIAVNPPREVLYRIPRRRVARESGGLIGGKVEVQGQVRAT
jgi:hypothetical protein